MDATNQDGTAISALTTVRLVTAHGFAAPFVLTAIVLGVYTVLATGHP
jgi:NNP family nitrate/nitrite transporter-like MFS transporter